jgi:hypothetical protein
MECSQIHKQLQSFLGDLLSEEEYRLFLEHLDGCTRCKPYVRSIGDLSNQVWKLGNVTVPADFRATVFFKLNHPAVPAAQENPSPPRSVQKLYVLGGLVAVMVLAVLFVKPAVLKTNKSVQMFDSVPIKTAQSFEQAAALPKPSVEAPPLVPEPATVTPPEKPVVLAEPTALPVVPQPPHWHLTYFSETSHRDESEKRQQGLVELQALLNKAQSFKTEFKRLEEENRYSLGQGYSEEGAREQAAQKAERDAALNTLVNEMRQLDGEIKRREDENSRIERQWREESAEKKRKDTQIKRKVLDTLVVLDAKFQYQDAGFFVFSVAPEKLDHVLENILPIFQQAGQFQDFGGGPSGSSGQEQQVSVYLDQGGVSGPHWHISAISSGQKIKLFDAIRELGGSKDYESEGVAVVSIPKTMIKELGIRLKSMRIPVSEFGHPETESTLLSNVPIKISICFSK